MINAGSKKLLQLVREVALHTRKIRQQRQLLRHVAVWRICRPALQPGNEHFDLFDTLALATRGAHRTCGKAVVAVLNGVEGSSVFVIKPPSFSLPVGGQHRGGADGGDRESWPFGLEASRLLPSSAPLSWQRPSADGQDHRDATFRVPCADAGAARSSPSACPWRRY
jgi:hypothetical protein